MRALVPLLMILSACDGDYMNHSLNLKLDYGDRTERMKINGPSTLEGEGALWPYEAAQFDLDTHKNVDGLVAIFDTYTIGTQPVSAELIIDGRRVPAGLTMVVERLRWANNRRYPIVHEGRLEGSADGAQVEGTFTISDSSCFNDILTDAGRSCGAHRPSDPGDAVWTYEILAEDTCPEAVKSHYLSGTTLTMSGLESFDAGGEQVLDCVVTERGDDRYTTSGEEKNLTGPVICGHDTTIEADGCTWSAAAMAVPAHSNGLSFTITAGVVDGSCEAQSCLVVVDNTDYQRP